MLGSVAQRLLLILLVVSSSLSPFLAHSDARESALAKVHALVSSSYRPTVKDVVELVESCPDCRDLLKDSSYFESQGGAALTQNAAILIAKLESVLPGGVYATLGRDAYWAADVLEAFYLSLGIDGRVSRLGASTSTFGGFNGQYSMFNFLKSNGLDVELAASGERPFAIIDRTRFSSGSQSTTLLHSVFSEQSIPQNIRSGLYGNVAVVSSQTGMQVTAGGRDHEIYIEHVRHSFRMAYGDLPSAIHIPELANFTDHHAVAWHDGFGPKMGVDKEGRITGNFGNPHGDHANVVRTFWKLYQFFSTPQVQDEVFRVAERYGLPNLRERLLNSRNSKSSATHNRLKRIIDADIENIMKANKVKGAEKELWQKLMQMRGSYWLSLVRNEGDLKAKDQAKLINGWRKDLSEIRKSSHYRTSYGILLNEVIFTLPSINFKEVTEDQLHTGIGDKKTYFSQNASRFLDFVKNEELDEERLLDLFTVISQAQSLSIFTPKDKRRLILYALAQAKPNASFYTNFGKLLEQQPFIKRMLVKKAKVFITSRKYKGRAEVVYRGLIARGLEMSAECAELLKAPQQKNEDDDGSKNDNDN